MNIQRFIQQELEGGSLADATVAKRRADLEDYLEWCQDNSTDPADAGYDEINKYLNEIRQNGYSDASISNRYYSLKKYYDYITEEDESPFNSSKLKNADYTNDSSGSAEERKKREDKEEIKYINKEEKDLLKANVPDPKLRNELLIELMWQTGIRQSEASLIELNDIVWDERKIDIFAPKTGTWREVFYQPSLDILLEQYINGGYRSRFTSAENSSYLFVSRKSERIAPGNINKVVRKAAELAGIQEEVGEDVNGDPRYRITSHAIRHGHAVHSLKSGIDISFIRQHLGHEDISTTQQYLDLVDTDVKQEYHNSFPASVDHIDSRVISSDGDESDG
ncbi:tyrosine-type recombinase/integrase, partial [Halorubrum glutamatedens]